MIGYYIDAHPFGKAVIALCCYPLKTRIRLPVVSNTQYNVSSFAVSGDHLLNSPQIILQIGVDRDHDVTRHNQESSHKCILMTLVAGKFDSLDLLGLST